MKAMADDLDDLDVKSDMVNFHQKGLHSESLVLTVTNGLDDLDVKADMVNFLQKRLQSESLVLAMPTMVYDLGVKAEVVIFHQKKLHSDLKCFDDQIHLQAQLQNLGND